MGFPEIGTKVILAVEIVDKISSGVMVRFLAARRISTGGRLGSISKLSTYIEDHHFHDKVYVINL